MVGYQGEFETFTPDDLFDDACFTAIAPELAILKDFVDDEGVSLGTATTLQAGETATLRIRVPNLGYGAASDVSLVDRLDTVNGVDSDGDDPHYAVEAAPAGRGDRRAMRRHRD